MADPNAPGSVAHTEFKPDFLDAERRIWAAVQAGTISPTDVLLMVDHASVTGPYVGIALQRVAKRLAHEACDRAGVKVDEPRFGPVVES
jgi:hypothetical protein